MDQIQTLSNPNLKLPENLDTYLQVVRRFDDYGDLRLLSLFGREGGIGKFAFIC